jgi:anti-sigma factor RsiW
MHVDEDVVAFLSGELAPAERARVDTHLETCAACRRTVDESRTVLAALAPGRPAAPPMDWARYQAELRAAVATRRRGWWWRPWPALAAVAVATVVLVLTLQTPERRLTDLATLDETVLGARLPLLQQYQVVERLDLFEDLDVIGQLDRIGTR